LNSSSANSSRVIIQILLMPIGIFLVDRISNKKYRINGCQESERPPSDPQLRKTLSGHRESELPPRVDLRDKMTPVEQQLRVASWYV
jgi:hypothetical protein